jgi:hypothetical protein
LKKDHKLYGQIDAEMQDMENWGKMFFTIKTKEVQFEVPDLSSVEF